MTTMTSKLDELKGDVYKAAKDGNVNELRRLIEGVQKGDVAEVVSSKTDDATPLIAACNNGHAETVRYLVDECAADIEQLGYFNHGRDYDVTPLWCAAYNNHLGIVKLLVTRGADVNNATGRMPTPLNEACNWANESIIEYLLDNKADINGTDEFGGTCLMLQCMDARYYMAKYLIGRGADINRKDRDGHTALHYCGIYYHLFSPDPSDSDSVSNSTGSMLKIMELLVQCEIKMEKDVYGFTPLLQAANNAEEDFVEHLIAIAETERTEKIEAFELLGARYMEKNDMTRAFKYWRVAMEERFRAGCPMARILLSFAELFSSMMTEEPRDVDFDIIMGILGKTVSELRIKRAKKAGKFEYDHVLRTTLNIIGLMCRIQGRFSEEQVYTLKKTTYEFVKLNLRDDRGYTPLHLTCEGSVHIKDFVLPCEDVAKILIECGASVNARDNDYGNTPLHVAAESNGLWKEDLMAALLEKGAHFDACNFVRETPMDLLRDTNSNMASSFALKYQTLRCLAARVIAANDIPYKGIVVDTLEDIVDMH